MRRDQSSLPFPHRSNPRYCASTVKHLRKRARPTHIVTMPTGQPGKKWTARVCESCARDYEGRREVTVETIKEAR